MAGYTLKSLKDKLGIKEDVVLLILHEPENYFHLLGQIHNEISHSRVGKYRFIHYFTRSELEFRNDIENLKTTLDYSGMLWISWPKKSSNIKSDLDENIVRGIALEHGLVDVKVCAIDEDWSGLKLVFRLKDRHNLKIE